MGRNNWAPLRGKGRFRPLIIQRFLRHCPVRAGAVFQALLTAIGGEWPPTENHILKQLS